MLNNKNTTPSQAKRLEDEPIKNKYATILQNNTLIIGSYSFEIDNENSVFKSLGDNGKDEDLLKLISEYNKSERNFDGEKDIVRKWMKPIELWCTNSFEENFIKEKTYKAEGRFFVSYYKKLNLCSVFFTLFVPNDLAPSFVDAYRSKRLFANINNKQTELTKHIKQMFNINQLTLTKPNNAIVFLSGNDASSNISQYILACETNKSELPLYQNTKLIHKSYKNFSPYDYYQAYASESIILVNFDFNKIKNLNTYQDFWGSIVSFFYIFELIIFEHSLLSLFIVASSQKIKNINKSDLNWLIDKFDKLLEIEKISKKDNFKYLSASWFHGEVSQLFKIADLKDDALMLYERVNNKMEMKQSQKNRKIQTINLVFIAIVNLINLIYVGVDYALNKNNFLLYSSIGIAGLSISLISMAIIVLLTFKTEIKTRFQSFKNRRNK